jgi:hypothetical protein
MTAASGKRRRPADTSARQAKEKPAALPDTRLPLRHTLNGYRMRHVDFTGAERLSLRTWDKGSARGEGPQKRQGGMLAAATAPWVPCEDCGSLRPAHAAGRHGAVPARGVARAAVGRGPAVPGWPACAHGVPHWENCTGAAVVPPCCLGEGSP